MNTTTTTSHFKLSHHFQHVGIISSCSLILLILALIFPFTTNASSALSPSDLQTNMPASGSIAVAVPGEATMDVVPTAGGSFSAITTNLQVATTNPTGYALYLHTNDSTNALVNVDQSSNAVVPAVGQAQLGSELNTNTWGFNLSSTVNEALSLTYQAVPSTLTSPSLSTKASSSDSYYLTFATKLDTSLPAGQYANNVVISAIANPLYVTGLLNLTYMQDMTSGVCANTVAYDGTDITNHPGNEVTKQLIDIRDGKEYWVAKLADGNCWMTQNLALDLNEKTLPLKPESSDLNSIASWRPATTTETAVPKRNPDPPATETRSWNMGEYVLATPTRNVSCNSARTADATIHEDGANSVRFGQTIEQNCTDFVNVSRGDWQPTFASSLAPEGTWTGTNYNHTTEKLESYSYTGPLAVDKNNKTYDAHYLIGNYYQWTTATAGGSSSGTDTMNTSESVTGSLTDTKNSICPKGWQLPKTGRNSVKSSDYYALPIDRDKSYYKLLYAYGYPNSTTIGNGINGWIVPAAGSAYANVLTGKYQDVALAPMYYLRAGYAYIYDASLRALGHTSSAWSSTISPAAKNSAYYFAFSDRVMPSHENAYQLGWTVRCLAR